MPTSEKPTPARLKKSSLALLLGTAGVFILGGAVAWVVLRRQPSSSQIPLGAELVPQDALIAISVSTDPNQWEQLQKFGTPQTRASLNQGIEQLRDRVLDANGYSYERDIQPWVGEEAMLALLPKLPNEDIPTPEPVPAPSPNQAGGAQPPNGAGTPPETEGTPGPTAPQQPMLAVLPIARPERARDLLADSKLQDQPLTERNYKGIVIRETQKTADQTLSFAVFDARFLTIANNSRAIEEAIDTFQSGESIVETAGYGESLQQIQAEQPFARLYVNIPMAAAFAAAGSSRPGTPENLAQLQQNQGLAATINLQSDGILIKGISWLKPGSKKTLTVENKARTMPSRLPANTSLMISGGNLQRLWQDYAQGAAANPIAPIQPNRLQQGIQSSLAMDWEQDFLAWMNGEFALALVPANQDGSDPFVAALAILAQTNDRRAAETALKKLDAAMSEKQGFKVSEAQIANQDVINWTSQFGGLTATRGWLDGNVAFLVLGAPVAESIVPKPAQPLAESDFFQRSVPDGLDPNNGHFFVDLDRASANIFSIVQLPPGLKTITNGIHSIGVTAAVSSSRSTRYDIFVALKKADEPVPVPTLTPSPNESP